MSSTLHISKQDKSQFKLDDFQIKGISGLREDLNSCNSVIAVSPGGSGKGEIIANILSIQSGKSICFVHSGELLTQIREKLLYRYDIISQRIDADTKYIDKDAIVYVVMAQTFWRRADSDAFLKNFAEIKLFICDEVHLGHFTKLLKFFPCKRIGFTATPLSSSLKTPLKKNWDRIRIIATQTEMLELNRTSGGKRGVVPLVCYSLSLKSLDRSKFKVKGEEFDEDEVSTEFKNPKQIRNTVNNFLKYAYGTKTVCFSSNRENSIEICEAFQKQGLNARHLDGEKSGKYGSDKYRKDTLAWFERTPNAILCNVRIIGIGYDVSSIETVIINSSIKSLSYWIQMIVRGARPHTWQDGRIKTHCVLLDFGNNARPKSEGGGGLGDGNHDQPWEEIFINPKKATDGIAPIKLCPRCSAINSTSVRYCQAKRIDFFTKELVDCMYEFPVIEKKEDEIEREMVRVLPLGKIDIIKKIEYFANRDAWFLYHDTISGVCKLCQGVYDKELDLEEVLYIITSCLSKLKEWMKLKNIDIAENGNYRTKLTKFPEFDKKTAGKVITELRNLGFVIDLEIEELIAADYIKEEQPLT